MINKADFGVYEVLCDECSHEDSYDVDGVWSRLMAEMDADGWRRRVFGDGWRHTCSDCNSLKFYGIRYSKFFPLPAVQPDFLEKD